MLYVYLWCVTGVGGSAGARHIEADLAGGGDLQLTVPEGSVAQALHIQHSVLREIRLSWNGATGKARR
jgi:hypothetical protein